MGIAASSAAERRWSIDTRRAAIGCRRRAGVIRLPRFRPMRTEARTTGSELR
jgi:hypothetical protein